MNERHPIIDVTPLSYSSEQQGASVRSSSQSTAYQQPSWKSSNGQRGAGSAYTRFRSPNPPFDTSFPYGTAETVTTSKTGGSAISGLVQIAVGTGLVVIGIPMLILPGPGLLSIAGGIALAANGARQLFS